MLSSARHFHRLCCRFHEGNIRRLEADPLLLEPAHLNGQEVGLEIAVGRRQRADAVEGDDYGLSVLEVEENLLLEERLLMLLVLLGGRDGTFAGRCPATEPADIGVGGRLGEDVADMGAVLFAAQFGYPSRFCTLLTSGVLNVTCRQNS
ncbi:MAG: hypothetical protein WDN23_13075 [Edaphobacter sp.]